jgi:hypothetical protein
MSEAKKQEEIEQDAKEVVEAVKEMVQEDLPEGASLSPETPSNEVRVAALKDEIERLETGLPNAASVVKGIKDKQQRVPKRAPNTPDISVENLARVTAEEAEKYSEALGIKDELAQKKDEVLRRISGGIAPPAMAAEPPHVGPRGATGPQNTPGPQAVPGPKGEPAQQRPQMPKQIKLDTETMLRVELLATKRKLADANEKLALIAVQDAQSAKKELEQEESLIMAQVREKLNIPQGANLRLIDKEKGICRVE